MEIWEAYCVKLQECDCIGLNIGSKSSWWCHEIFSQYTMERVRADCLEWLSEWICHFMSLSFFFSFFIPLLPMCVCNEILAKPSTDCSNHPSVKSQWGMAAFPLISFHLSFLHSLNPCFISPLFSSNLQRCKWRQKEKRSSGYGLH